MRVQILAAALLLVQPLIAREPTLSCEKKIGEIKWEGKVLHRYALRGEHFPPQQQFNLVFKSFDGTRTKTYTYLANQRGHLIFQPPEYIKGEIYALCPARKGERLTFVMEATEGNEAYETDLVPFPIQMRSKKGVKLNMELQGERGEKFFLFAQGLKPHEKVELYLEMEGKKLSVESTVTSLGDLCAYIYPSGEAGGGEAKLHLVRKNEEVVFPFQWGDPALDYIGACCFEIR